MTPPLIGITERRLSSAQIVGTPPTFSGWMSAQYVEYARGIARAGGVPVHLSREADPESLVERLDGFIFAGGLDVDPRLYGSVPGPASTPIDPRSDRFELELLLEALQADVPLIGVCRGMQLLNVALGGTLVSDLPVGAGQSHSFVLYPPVERVHRVSFTDDSPHAELYGPEVMVNSLHHQAVAEPGEGVVVVGRAADGVAEALMVEGRRALGVQWHPELLREPDPIFDWLIAEAGGEPAAVGEAAVVAVGAGLARATEGRAPSFARFSPETDLQSRGNGNANGRHDNGVRHPNGNGNGHAELLLAGSAGPGGTDEVVD
jgi:putative glutamine amidotransferase